ncbi:MAG: hypothetical protein K9M96_04390 [Deltaproteobacteria bacterium]|nr:hypothetical protein [Deltaproteobacteria bacterium]MCF8120087.1 hypothetical protein [Deltaproteobacteria bacterium]
MSENFQVLVHEEDGSLHLKLVGEFDARSATDVLKIVDNRRPVTSRVFIHTNCLKKIHPEAQKVFQESIDSMEAESIPVLFTGEKAGQLAPDRNNLC